MMNTFETYYFVCMTISIILLLVGIFYQRKRYNMFAIGIMCGIFLIVLSNYWMFNSTSFPEGILAYKINLLAECILPLWTTFYLAQICGFHVQKRFVIGGFVLMICLYLCSAIPSFESLIYHSLSFMRSNGFLYVQEDMGIILITIRMIEFILIVVDFGMIVYVYKNNRNISYTNVKNMILLGLFIGTYFILNALITLPFDIMVVLCFFQLFFMFIARKVTLYSLDSNEAKEVLNSSVIGYIAFDDKHNFLCANQYALEWFPELEKQEIDKPLESNIGIMNSILEWFERVDNSGSTISDDFVCKKKNSEYNIYITATMERFPITKKRLGYRILLRDETNKQSFINILSAQKKEAEAKSTSFSTRVSSYLSDPLKSSFDKEDILKAVKGEIVVMFADIRGFTSLSEGRQPEVMVEILNRVLDSLTAPIEQNRGIIDKFIGDCVMAYWVVSKEPESAYLACKCAKDMADTMRKLNPKLMEEYGIDVHIGIGINKGDAIVGSIGSIFRKDFTCIGDTVNIASRLEGIAAKDQTVVTKAVIENLDGRIETKQLSSFKPKGKTKDVEVYELISVGGRK